MRSLRRLSILLCLALALAAYSKGPDLLGLDAMAREIWIIPVQIGGPLLASIICFLAARRSIGGDRSAWTNFGIASLFYVTGNVCYLVYALFGVEARFPTLPEASYFIMALFFAIGIFQYGKLRRRINRVQFFNFILIYCAVTLTSLFLLHGPMSQSVMDPLATLVAFLYPALWFSVAAFGLVSLLIYDQHGKGFVLALLLAGIAAEAGADYVYALALMDGSYAMGGITQLLWVGSTALIIWAGAEQMAMAPRTAGLLLAQANTRDNEVTQAAVSSAALAIVLLGGTISSALAMGPYLGFSVGLGLIFALVTGLREHWVIHVQKKLRRDVEAGQAELAESRQRLAAVLQSTGDGVLVLDRHWRIEFFNQRAQDSLGTRRKLTLGASFWEIFPLGDGSEQGALYRAALEAQRPAEFEEFVADEGIWLEIGAYPSGEGLSVFFRDISEQRRAREEIAHLAHHDPLTGLANRVLFQDRLHRALEAGTPLATLLLDLDHFKDINDTLGHAVGDTVLTMAAERLRRCLHPAEMVARLGGDEFAVIVTDKGRLADLARIAETALQSLGMPLLVDGESVRIGASIGIACCDGQSGDPGQLFRNADIALYAAKAGARGGYCFFEPAMEAALQQRRALRDDLAQALAGDQFELAYQPLLDLKSGGICAFEALLRWRHPKEGLISPDVFIPIAEETGLIVPIGDWVLNTAAAQAMAWPEGVSVAVNLSTCQFANSNLAQKVALALRSTGLDPARLELEITESVLLRDSSANMATLRALRDLGVRIALDDFGTGYSSLGYLQRFPFSKIKIDRSFISGLPDKQECHAIVRSIIGLGQSLGMRVTAEGVETQAQYDWIAAGCDEVQGYFISRPVPADAVAGLLEKHGTTPVEQTPELPVAQIA